MCIPYKEKLGCRILSNFKADSCLSSVQAHEQHTLLPSISTFQVIKSSGIEHKPKHQKHSTLLSATLSGKGTEEN